MTLLSPTLPLACFASSLIHFHDNSQLLCQLCKITGVVTRIADAYRTNIYIIHTLIFPCSRNKACLSFKTFAEKEMTKFENLRVFESGRQLMTKSDKIC